MGMKLSWKKYFLILNLCNLLIIFLIQDRFYNWTHDQFLQMCILSGCDYLPSIPGVGSKIAYNYIAETKSYELSLKRMRFDGKYKIPANYLDSYKLALETFRHQRVYDVCQDAMTHLQPLPKELLESERDFDHLGLYI